MDARIAAGETCCCFGGSNSNCERLQREREGLIIRWERLQREREGLIIRWERLQRERRGECKLREAAALGNERGG